MTWKISKSAYVVASLHFAKHGNSDCVFGLLLGDSKERKISCAVPLAHTYVMPTSLSIGLAITHEYAETHLLEIVGAYSKSPSQLKLVMPTIAAKVRKGGSTVALAFDDSKLEKDELMFSAKGDKGEGIVLSCEDDCGADLVKLIDQDAYLKIIDLDEHFVDPSKDFLDNERIVRA